MKSPLISLITSSAMAAAMAAGLMLVIVSTDFATADDANEGGILLTPTRKDLISILMSISCLWTGIFPYSFSFEY